MVVSGGIGLIKYLSGHPSLDLGECHHTLGMDVT